MGPHEGRTVFKVEVTLKGADERSRRLQAAWCSCTDVKWVHEQRKREVCTRQAWFMDARMHAQCCLLAAGFLTANSLS